MGLFFKEIIINKQHDMNKVVPFFLARTDAYSMLVINQMLITSLCSCRALLLWFHESLMKEQDNELPRLHCTHPLVGVPSVCTEDQQTFKGGVGLATLNMKLLTYISQLSISQNWQVWNHIFKSFNLKWIADHDQKKYSHDYSEY